MERGLADGRVPGIASGKKLRVRGKGRSGPGGPSDLFLKIDVAADPRFERDGANLTTVAYIPPSTLLLGGLWRSRRSMAPRPSE